MKRNLWIFLPVALAAAIGGFLASDRMASAPPSAALLFSQSLPDIKGQSQSLSQWKGKTLVVNFWATWCAPCVQEMPELSALQNEISEKNIQIIGIGIDSSANIAEFSEKYKISYPLYVAGMEGSQLLAQFGNQAGGLPFTIVFSKDGTVRKTYLGRLKMDELRAALGSI